MTSTISKGEMPEVAGVDGCGEFAAMSEAQIQREWERQCNTHDSGVDRLPMGHPTIENAAARMKKIEREQRRRGFETGPHPSFFGEE